MFSLKDFKAKLQQEGSVTWDPNTSFEQFWQFDLRGDREDIWTYLSDTSRFNREVGLAGRIEHEQENGVLSVNTTVLGFAQEWVEQPWCWVAGETMVIERDYKRGIAKKVQIVYRIEDAPDHSKRMVFIYFGWQPSNIIWNALIRLSEFFLFHKFKAVFARIDLQLAKKEKFKNRHMVENLFVVKKPKLSPLQISKFESAATELRKLQLNENSVREICNHVREGDELDLQAIRLVPLAEKWGLPLDSLVLTCLYATRVGLLNISWEVICPHCRGSRARASSLGDIPEKAACAVCEIDFATDGPDSIEVVFHVNPAVRVIPDVEYCAAEPAKKSHIKLQQKVAPGHNVDVKLNLAAGAYRGRFIGESSKFSIQVGAQGSALLDVNRPESKEFLLRTGEQRLIWKNAFPVTRFLIVEEASGQNAALKPIHIFSLPEFRDLFSEEHLSTNVKLYVGEQSLLFTDIVGSTKFYNTAGDAKAFLEVRNHFQELYALVKRHQGSVVKTIGDALMASFPSPQEALFAAVDIQECFHAHRTDTQIRLRVSVHVGNVIAVKLNSGLDYFGTTVNFAAKIQACADAAEIALSPEMYKVYQSIQEKVKIDAVATKIYRQDDFGPFNIQVLTVDPTRRSNFKAAS